MPTFSCADALVPDFGIQLASKPFVTQTQRHGVSRQLVQELGRGNSPQIIRVDREAFDHGITHGRGLFPDDLTELFDRGLFLVFAKGVLEQGAQETGTEERSTQFGERQSMQPVPCPKLHASEPAIEGDEHDAGEGERDSKQGRLGLAEAKE